MQNETQILEDLSPQQQVIFRLLRSGRSVKIETIFLRLYPNGRVSVETRRDMQMSIGKIISALNARLAKGDCQVVPGTPRGTYVLRNTV